MTAVIARFIVAAFSLGIGGTLSVSAQTSDSCSSFASVIEGSSSSNVPVVPENLLTEWQTALPCLARIVGGLKITSPTFEPVVRSRFLSSTGAIRAIMTKMSVADDNAKKMTEEKRPPLQLPVFTTSFRELENFFEVV